jgi:predicted anti-sigma-YlaC factor YlaD
MRCEQARQTLIDTRYGGENTGAGVDPDSAIPESSPELRAHLAQCEACRALQAHEAALDRWLALDEPAAAGPGFDTRFFARLRAEKARTRRRRVLHLAWALVPLAAGAAFVFLRPTHTAQTPASPASQVPTDDLGLAMELDLVQDMELARKLDDVEAYEVLSQVDERDLERLTQEDK